MGMREYNADNKTTRLVGKWEFRKGGYSNDADLEKSSSRQLPLWANVQRPGQTKGSELRTISLPGRRKVKLPTLPGIFMSKNNTLSTDREGKYYV